MRIKLLSCFKVGGLFWQIKSKICSLYYIYRKKIVEGFFYLLGKASLHRTGTLEVTYKESGGWRQSFS